MTQKRTESQDEKSENLCKEVPVNHQQCLRQRGEVINRQKKLQQYELGEGGDPCRGILATSGPAGHINYSECEPLELVIPVLDEK